MILRAVLLALLAWSGSPAAAEVLTWEDCVSLALRQNPDLSAARFSREASRADYLGSYNGLFPSLSLSNSYSTSDAATRSTLHYSAGATASVKLFDAGRYASIRSASAGYARASASLRQEASDLRLSLRRAFLQLLFAQENVETSRRINEMRRRGAELVTLRYNSGRESKGNMLRAQAQLLQADADLAQARRELRTSQRSLDVRLGYDDFKAFVATGTLSTTAPPDFPENAEPLISRRPDVQASLASIRTAEAGVSSAKSTLWPSLSASYSRNVSGRTEFPNSSRGWTAGGTLSLPLFGGGPTEAYFNVEGANAGLERARHELRSTRVAAALDVETTWSDFSRTSSQSGVQAALLDAARQRNEEADVRYASGLLSYDNWEIISTDRINQERQALQARVNAAVSEASWEHALGRELGE
ncbi:MAG: TolC family protein [Elusimicrobia bacterium]|nr:TolC family protein [Elusimicrobiota bacterium]